MKLQGWSCPHCGTVYANSLLEHRNRDDFMDHCCIHFFKKAQAWIHKDVIKIGPVESPMDRCVPEKKRFTDHNGFPILR